MLPARSLSALVDMSANSRRAKAYVERYAEERLFDKDGANGAKFSLANNFEGWKEKREIDADVNSTVNINNELYDDDELI
jgi:hypothetical protein